MISKIKDNGYLIFVFLGCLILFFSGYALLKTFESKSWPTTTGKIIVSEIKATLRGGRSYSVNPYTYKPNIEYSYSVFAQYHISNNIFWGWDLIDGLEYSQTTTKNYPINELVKVYYNPQHPEEATLKFNESYLFMLFVVGIIFIVFGYMMKK